MEKGDKNNPHTFDEYFKTNKMEKTKKAVEYMIDVWDEVTGKTWRERPDHVQQKFLDAENELKNSLHPQTLSLIHI